VMGARRRGGVSGEEEMIGSYKVRNVRGGGIGENGRGGEKTRRKWGKVVGRGGGRGAKGWARKRQKGGGWKRSGLGGEGGVKEVRGGG